MKPTRQERRRIARKGPARPPIIPADQKLLLEFARMQLRIATAKAAPVDRMAITERTVQSSAGYVALRRWWIGLSNHAKAKARTMFRSQIDGVAQVIELAKRTGEPVSLADLTIEIRDVDDDAPARMSCPGSNLGISTPVDDHVGCSRCRRRWPVGEIGFRIPEHEEKT